MKIIFFDKLRPTIKKVGFNLKKHSPEIFVAAGVIGVVTSAIMACVATTKIKKVVNEFKEEVDSVHNSHKDVNTENEKHNLKRELTKVYLKTGFKFVKLYATSVVLGGLSLASIVASNVILRRRTIALAAAYSTVDKSFKDYRSRVVERFGDTVDKELKYGIKTKTLEEKTIDPISGKETTVKKEIRETSYDGYSDYARYFNESSIEYIKHDTLDNTLNLGKLSMVQQYFNDKLISDKYVFLNDVYEYLGLQKTLAGQAVGWIYDKEDNIIGDNRIDFGLKDITEKSRESYMKNGERYNILLDFNVDGPILDRVKW